MDVDINSGGLYDYKNMLSLSIMVVDTSVDLQYQIGAMTPTTLEANSFRTIEWGSGQDHVLDTNNITNFIFLSESLVTITWEQLVL